MEAGEGTRGVGKKKFGERSETRDDVYEIEQREKSIVSSCIKIVEVFDCDMEVHMQQDDGEKRSGR